MNERRIYSVSQINRYIRGIIESDAVLESFWIKGEISNFKLNSSGHIYFSIKDKSGAINCVMFRSAAENLKFKPYSGMEVVICGYATVYEKSGQYQIVAEYMEPLGAGALNLAFLQLKERLSEEGLFDECYKREIKKYPETIAVITSPTGAAVRDIIQVIKRRNSKVKIVVFPVLVQGRGAAEELVAAVKSVNKWGLADTIIIGRGGGSAEDLWAFNEEILARAVFASNIPVISAVGHETDYTITDFVSDLRAPTPSAAAELAVDNEDETYLRVSSCERSIKRSITDCLNLKYMRVDTVMSKNAFKRPRMFFNERRLLIDAAIRKINREILLKLKNTHIRLDASTGKIEALSPFAVMKRGYSIVKNEKGVILKTAGDAFCGETVGIRFYDGEVKAVIKDKVIENG